MSTTTLRLGTSSSGIRTFHHSEFPLERLLDAKGATSVSVCLPARNEASTVGSIVSTLRTELLDTGAVDEIVVVDDHSSDDTARVASEAGARVADAAQVLSDFGGGHGKGEVLWKSLHVTEGDIVLWCDSDISEFGPRFVSGLLGPLLCEPGVDFAKGYYRRPEREREGGGRVTELVARPLLSLYFPELVGLHQPLSGEYGGRREVLERLPFFQGYGVDMGLLIDLSRSLRRRGTGPGRPGRPAAPQPDAVGPGPPGDVDHADHALPGRSRPGPTRGRAPTSRAGRR